MQPRYRNGEPGFCLRTRANPVAPDPSSAPQPQGRGHVRLESRLCDQRILISIKSPNLVIGFHVHIRVSAALKHLEMKMTTVKGLAIVALLVGGTSLAVAQGQPTGAYPPVAGGAGGNPAAPPIPNVYGATTPTPSHHATTHHKKMYMSAKSHKGSKLQTKQQ